MPTIGVFKDELEAQLGRAYTEDEFADLCFDFGIELDDVTTEAQMAEKAGATGTAAGPATGSDRVIYRIDIPANRYDLLCIEGLARALRIFLGKQSTPTFTVTKPEAPLTMTVKAATAVRCAEPSLGAASQVHSPPTAATQSIRPYVVSAVLRGLNITPAVYKSCIDLQDKLHQNICRRRTLVAIGTHDLATLTPPFTYDARAPGDIAFVPLTQGEEFTADKLMEFYETDVSVKHIKPYVSIIKDSPVYPVITDATGTVLSLPPIINGEHSKLTTATRDMLIECTATDLTKAHIVLNTMVTMLSEHCAEPFSVEPVQVVYEDPAGAPDAKGGYVTPQLDSRTATARVADINGICGTKLAGDTIVSILPKMQLDARLVEGGEAVEVVVPPTRTDILHAVDIAEDVAIAYGYNNIVKTIPATPSTAYQQPVNKLTDLLRVEMAGAGYTECLTMALVSRKENFTMLRHEDDDSAVTLGNPKTKEFEVGRTQLTSGLLKSLASNKDQSFATGVKLFEISDVMVLDSTSDVGAVNQRNLAALFCSTTAGFEVMHGLVDRIMTLLSVPLHPDVAKLAVAGAHKEAISSAAAAASGGAVVEGDAEWTGQVYKVQEGSNPTFLPGRSADIVVVTATGTGAARKEEAKVVGTLGVVHPEVLKAFELDFPASTLELNLQGFV